MSTAAPIAPATCIQLTYQLVDVYFVSQLGAAAIAAVNAAGNVVQLIHALTQVLTVGTIALISQIIGRRNHADANVVFNQALTLSLASSFLLAMLLLAFVRTYMQLITANPTTIDASVQFT